ncbi:MAG: hypothetical protein ABWX67_09490 [Allosphingosinicella sp.]
MKGSLVLASAFALATAAQSAPLQADVPVKAKPANRMICKTYVRIGTLADRHRVCKTKAEWDEERNLRELNPSDACRTNDDAFAPCK